MLDDLIFIILLHDMHMSALECCWGTISSDVAATLEVSKIQEPLGASIHRKLTWLWINTYRYSSLGDEHPFTSYFGVHQGYKVLTHPHMFRQVKHGKSREKLHRCPYRMVILSQSNRRVGTFSEKHACGSACSIGTYWSYNQHLDTGQQIGMGFVSFRPKYPGMQRFTS